MTGRTFERSRVEPIPFPLRPQSVAGGQNAFGTLPFRKTKADPRGEAYSVAGCLRGLCWGVVIECALAFGAYEAWHLWQFLR